ncbi:oligosaccharide flippase family protein [Pseudoalteromonas fenneropenaei]|uniref:Oligosaccharide flippase family protein n=1 Tax=Pseudoalteromonas fenneropenaei TaxID=1737459 RepID=A0ABV7CCE8_9GAMM
MTTSHAQYLSHGALFLVISIVLGYGADYAFNLTLSQHLSVAAYGDYKVAYSFTTLASVLVLLGGDRLAPRILARPISEQQTQTVMAYLVFYLKYAAMISCLVIALTWGASFLYVVSFDKADHHALAIMVIAVPLIAVGAILSRVLQSAKQLAAANLPWRLALPLGKTLLVLAAAQFVVTLSLIHVIAIGILVVSVIVLWQLFYLNKHHLLARYAPSKTLDNKQLLQLSIPMMLAMLVTMLLNQADIFMLELISHEHHVGHFGAANTLAHLIPVTQVTIASLFMPLIGHYFDKQPEEAKALFHKAQRVTVLCIVTVVIALMLFAKPLLTLFGTEYQHAESALLWLIAGYGIWALVAPSVTWQQYQGKGQQIVWIGLLAIVVDIGANLVLIPRYDVAGAAMATALALSIAAIAVVLLNRSNTSQ